MSRHTMPESVANSIDHLVFDLSASERNLRLAAIFQLGTRLADPKVRQALEEQQTRESDPEVLFFLQQTLAQKPISPAGGTSPTGGTLPNWRGLSPDRFHELLVPLSHLEEIPRGEAVLQILSARPPATLLQTLFELGPKFPLTRLSDAHLHSLLFHPNPGVGVRALYQTSRHAPERGLPFLPALLQRPSLLTRALALRLLYRYVPDQAMRLLEEFLDHPEPAQRGIGIGLLFQFPFEEIAGALLNLIEADLIPRSSEDLVLTLIRSNPNPGFALRLARLESNYPGRPGLGIQAEAAANALLVSGLENGPLASLRLRLQERADQEIEGLLQSPAGQKPAPPPTPEARKDQGLAPAPDLKAGPAGDPVTFQQALVQVRHATELIPLLVPMIERRERQPEFGLPAFVALHKFPTADSRLIAWSESLLEHTPEPLLLAAMKYLERHASRRLLSHLPVLAFHSSAFVASQAVRILRTLEGSAFFKRLDSWIRDPDPRARRAAMAGLLQLDFTRARTLVLRHLRAATEPDVLEGLERLICMNPDHRLIAEIQSMAAQAGSTQRREFLLRLARNCQVELSRLYGSSGTSSSLASLRELWADQVEMRLGTLLEQLRLIHFSHRPSWQEDRERLLWVAATFISVLAVFLFFRTSEPGFRPAGTASTAGESLTRLTRGASGQRFVQPTTVIGKLESFDPLTHYWKFRTSDGSLHKLRFASGTIGQEAGKRISAEIVFLGTSPLGYNLYTVRQFQILSP